EEKQKQGVIVAGENGEGNNLNQFHNLYGLTVDDDDQMYVADFGCHRIMRWSV
ncbi:unnamed protein product, partial [Adineta steineri]